MTASSVLASRLRTVFSDMARGFFEITHNGFALLGLVVVVALTTVWSRPDLQQSAETRMLSWLQARHVVDVGMSVEPDAVERATAVQVASLPKQQAQVAAWIARKYSVAPEAIGALVSEAYEVGAETKVDPLLILAIMAIESSFNPFAQSPVGAQGLMQVMTHIHRDKYEHFGGKLAALDPVTNLRVGVKVLQECIQRAGSLEGGLKYYVGAAFHDTDGGYAAKVLGERARLAQVAGGQVVAMTANTPAVLTAPQVQAVPAGFKPTQLQPSTEAVAEPVSAPAAPQKADEHAAL
jgi:Transglycosylase SLT domain